MLTYKHTVSGPESVKTLWRVGDYPLPDSLRPRLTPLSPDTKTPLPCAVGGPRWSLTGPHSNDMLDRLDARYRPGWGVRTGMLAGLPQASLVVLDVDDPEAAPDWIDDLEAFPWRVYTWRGVHVYGFTPEPVRNRPLDFGDVKGQNGYVVLSQPSGDYRPAPGFGVGQLPLWPESVLSDLLRTDSGPDSPAPTASPRPERPQTRPGAAFRRPVVAPVSLPIGSRNAGLFRRLTVAAGRDADLRGDTARLTGLGRYLNAHLDVPLPDEEVVKLSASASAYSAGWESSTEAFREKQRLRGQRSGEARRALTADRDNLIVSLAESGESWSTIARTLGVSRSTVARTLRD